MRLQLMALHSQKLFLILLVQWSVVNTETGISVTYQDGDNTIDFALAAAQTTITSLLATDIKIGEDDQTKIDFETADEIHFYAANAHQIKLLRCMVPATDNDVD